MNYGELKTRFMGLLKRRDITTTDRDQYIQDGIARCQTILRVPAMETQFTITMDELMDGSVPVPANYLEMRSLYVGTTELSQKSLSEVLRLRSGMTNCPIAYTRRGGAWLIAPFPLVGTEVHGDYYAELPALTLDADTNWLSIIRPNAILFAALADAAPFFVDRRGDSWEAKFQQVIGELQEQADDDELTNGQVEPAFQYPSEC